MPKVLIAGNLFAAIVGVIMMVAPGRLARWSRLPDKWVFTGQFTSPLDAMWNLDSQALKRPRVVVWLCLPLLHLS